MTSKAELLLSPRELCERGFGPKVESLGFVRIPTETRKPGLASRLS
jgi:hypothetical protein